MTKQDMTDTNMINTRLMVLDVGTDIKGNEYLWTKTTSCSECTACNNGAGCPSNLFNIFGGDKTQFRIDVDKSHPYKIGDTLEMSLSAYAPLLVASIVYFIPLLIFITLVVFGHYVLSLSEVGVILLSLSSLSYYLLLSFLKPSHRWQKLWQKMVHFELTIQNS